MLCLFALVDAAPAGEQLALTPGPNGHANGALADTMTELDFEMEVKQEQLIASWSEAHGGQRCPKNTPVGVLYNHVSKTGGTSMKQLLQEAMCDGNWGKKCRVQMKSHYVKRKADDGATKVTDNGALFIEDDTQHMKLKQDDADNFFVIGLVRRPCDYALSVWATMNDVHGHDKPFHGTKAPYDKPEDFAGLARARLYQTLETHT